MTKNYLLKAIVSIFYLTVNAQVTETFETSTIGSSSFNNGLTTISLAPSSSFKVSTIPGNFGYLSSANYIENTNANPCSIKLSNTFRIGSLYLYPSTNGGNENQTTGVDVTFIGKLNNVNQFTYVPPAANFTGASYTNTTNRGFTLVNFSVPGFQNTIIDELFIDINGAGNYIAIDNFTFTTVTANANDFNFNSKIKVYPNPSNSIYNIDIDSNSSIVLFDLIGKKIQSKNLSFGINTLDLSNYNNGIYFLKVTNELNQSKTIKLIKE